MKLTKKREEIINKVKDEKKALSAKEVSSLLPKIDQATVYRNLNLFVKEGLLKKFSFSSKEAFYEMAEKDHHHAVCDDCEKVRHLHISDKEILKSLDLDDFKAESVEVIVRGRCG